MVHCHPVSVYNCFYRGNLKSLNHVTQFRWYLITCRLNFSVRKWGPPTHTPTLRRTRSSRDHECEWGHLDLYSRPFSGHDYLTRVRLGNSYPTFPLPVTFARTGQYKWSGWWRRRRGCVQDRAGDGRGSDLRDQEWRCRREVRKN